MTVTAAATPQFTFTESEVDLGEFTVGVSECQPAGEPRRARAALLMLHAIGLDRHMWREVAGLLCSEVRPISIDLRGHGRAAGATAAMTMKDLAADVVAAADRLGLPEFHLAGLSWGGAIAQEVALAVPHRLLSLALAATVCKAFPAMRERAEAARRGGMEPQVQPTLERWFSSAALAGNGASVMYAAGCLRSANPKDWANAWDTFSTFDVAERLPLLGRQAFSVRVIAGEADVSATVSMMRSIAELIPGAQLHVIGNAPHMIALEHPRELARLLQQVQR